jgi:hypothetical protein
MHDGMLHRYIVISIHCKIKQKINICCEQHLLLDEKDSSNSSAGLIPLTGAVPKP